MIRKFHGVEMQRSKSATSKKQAAIVEAGENLFSRFGAKRVTVEEICRKAGASKMTFYKYFPNKVALVKHIRDNWVETGFRKFDEIDALDIPYLEKIDRMTRWKVEFGTRVNADFIRELSSFDDIANEVKRRFLGNIVRAQNSGDIRQDISPELIWLVSEKLYELVQDGSWRKAFTDFSEYQKQIRTILFYGLLTRTEKDRS